MPKIIHPEPEKKPRAVEARAITDELKESYLDYAMSVIVSRALPDIRDGLKPVQRRILFAMWDLGLTSGAKFMKSARVVGECFAKNTLIATEEGLLPIQSVRIGSMVFTQNGLREVKQLFEMPPQPLLKVILKNNATNIVTPSQKFKVLKPDLSFEWKEAQHLTVNDYLVLRCVYPEIKNPILVGTFENRKVVCLNEDLAYLLGLFVSDGWVSSDYGRRKRPRIGFAAKDKKVLEKIKKTLEKKFGYSPTIETKEYKLPIKTGPAVDKKIRSLRINRKSINEFLVHHFDLEGKKAPTKEIPPQIFQSPSSVIFSFVGGLIEGDGCVSKRKNLISYSSTSEKLVDQLTALLLSQGIFSDKYLNKVLHKKEHFVLGRKIVNQHQSYSVEIKGENAVTLASKIILMDEEKNKKLLRLKLKKLTSYDRKGPNVYDHVPYAAEVLFRELSEAHLGSGWYRDSNGDKFRMGIKYPIGAKIRYSADLKEKTLRKTQIVEWGIKDKLERIESPFFNFVNLVVKNNLFFTRVSAVEKCPAEATYDLEVDGDHEFIANGVLAHNCMGKYHPHGDMAVYDALVRIAQDFSLRYPLVQGQGNFGSVDGDVAAAQRYTEVKLSKIAEEALTDIEKGTVEWRDNYDNSRLEPIYLPARLPNLILNGTVGIAVGMATSIPPHNLVEVVDALTHLSKHPNVTVTDLMQFIPGPDFPTGGAIYDRRAIESAYQTGRGSITMRGVAEIEEGTHSKHSGQARGSFQIIISEIPYQVNKSNLITKMAELVTDKKIEGIKDLRDESDRDGLRIVIDLKSDAAPQKILNQLYQFTELQKNFYFNMLALVDGLQPQILSLKEVLAAYLTHRAEVIRRRTAFDLAHAEERAHILEGLVKALDSIDIVIATIKKSDDKDDARANLIKKFDFTEIQASAILEMRLQTLAALERGKLESELKEKWALIAALKLILKNPAKITEIIMKELAELKRQFPSPRRTKVVVAGLKEFNDEDLIAQEDIVLVLTEDGYLKRLPPTVFRAQRRGGKGLIGFDLKEEDQIHQIVSATTHDNVLFFTDRGRVFQTKAYEIPVSSRIAKGKSILNFLSIPAGERVTALVAYPSPKTKLMVHDDEAAAKNRFLFMATAKGVIKKTPLEDFGNVRRNGIIALKLGNDDTLRWATLSSGSDEVILVTAKGQSIRFKEKDVRPMGRTAGGVGAVRLKKGDEVAGLDIIRKQEGGAKEKLLVVMARGFAKQTLLKEYKVQRRGGGGIRTAKVTEKTGRVMAALIVTGEEEEVLAFSSKGQALRTKLSDVRVAGRATQGVRIINLEKGDTLIGLVCL